MVDVLHDLLLFLARIGSRLRESVDCAIADPHESDSTTSSPLIRKDKAREEW